MYYVQHVSFPGLFWNGAKWGDYDQRKRYETAWDAENDPRLAAWRAYGVPSVGKD